MCRYALCAGTPEWGALDVCTLDIATGTLTQLKYVLNVETIFFQQNLKTVCEGRPVKAACEGCRLVGRFCFLLCSKKGMCSV